MYVKYTYVKNSYVFSPELFDNKLNTPCAFISILHCVFPKNTDILLYNYRTVINFRTFNIDVMFVSL